jgi:hypothetical protein
MSVYDDYKAGKIKPTTPLEGAANVIKNIAPMATSLGMQNNISPLQAKQVYTKPTNGNIIEEFGKFAGSLGSQVGGLALEAGKGLLDSTIRLVEAPISLVGRLVDAPRINANIERNTQRLNNLDIKRKELTDSWSQGRISKEEYLTGLKGIAIEGEEIRKEANTNAEEATAGLEGSKKDAVDTAVSAITALSLMASGGLSGIAVGASELKGVAAKNVINFFGKREVSANLFKAATKIDDIMKATAGAINKVGTLNGKLTGGEILKIGEAAKVAGLGTMSAGQIAKKVALDVLIKKPLIYQTNVDQAINTYVALAEGNYGEAAKSAAINAGFLLSGGPIGFAMDVLKKGIGAIKSAAYNGGTLAKMMERENANALKKGVKKAYSKELIDEYRKSKISGGSFYDALSLHIGNGKANQIFEALQKRIDAGDLGAVKMMKVMEDVNMQMAGGNAYKAAMRIAEHYNANTGNRLLRELTPDQLIDDMVNHAILREKVIETAIKGGMPKAEAERIVLGRLSKTEIGLIADYMKDADAPFEAAFKAGNISREVREQIKEARKTRIDALLDRYSSTSAWANNDALRTQLYNIADYTKDTTEMLEKIGKLVGSAKFSGKLPKKLLIELKNGGYIATMPKTTFTPYIKYEDTNKKIATQFSKGLGEKATYFEKAVKPIPFLSHINGALTKLGLGTEPSIDLTYKMMKNNFSTMIATNPAIKNSLGKDVDGEDVLAKLYSFIRNQTATQKWQRPIVDLRQMTNKEIQSALKVDTKQARAIMSALNTAMMQVPVSIRGLGDKVLDFYNKIPFASQYSRTQGATRYTYNPFFRWQQGYQTEFGALIESGGGKRLQMPGLNWVNKILFPKSAASIDNTIELLQKNNIFGQGFSGMGNTGDVFGKLGTHLIASEKRSLAGLVELQAKRAGKDVQTYIEENMDNVIDTLQTLTFSNKTKSLADSPLARTINTVFFPFRFNMKVANLMAKQMSKFNTATQVAIIANALKADEFLKSDEGIAWQTQYADAIKFFNWISPTYPLTYIAKIAGNITDPENASIGDFGLLGGLPFGMVTQILEANGIIPGSIPYMNPKTGDVLPKYVPQTTKAQMNLALQAFIGSVWSYPGSIMGLPGKGELIRGGVNALMGAQDFEAVDRTAEMTPEQLRAQPIIKRVNGAKPNTINASNIDNNVQAIQPTIQNTMAQPIVVQPQKRVVKPKAKKKSEYPVTPLTRK